MAELKKAAHEMIDKCKGFILFPFVETEMDMNGQKGKVAKAMVPQTGAIGGGNVNLAFVASKAESLLQMENSARNQHIAKMAEV